MASSALRRPLPALISLVALLVLTGLVWWRVLNRDTTTEAAQPACPTPTAPTASPTTSLPRPSTVDVEVLNATSRTGIAGDARTALQAAGFTSSQQAGNYSGNTKITGVGQIRFGPAGKANAALVHYYLPGSTLVAIRSTKPLVTVVLGPQYKRVASKASASAAIVAGRATVSGAPSASSSKPGC